MKCYECKGRGLINDDKDLCTVCNGDGLEHEIIVYNTVDIVEQKETIVSSVKKRIKKMVTE